MMLSSVFRKAALAGLILVALAAVLQAQISITTKDGLTIHAKSGEQDKDRITASGDVELLFKDIRLLADTVEVNTKTKDAVARGHVTIQMPTETVDCVEIVFNLTTALGDFKKATGRIQPSVLYEAESVTKKQDNLYNLVKAYFTSCSQPVPRWKFSFSRANLKKDDYVEMWNAVLSIKAVPVFYWPYMRYPLGQQQRQTGFLMPKVGYSKVKGFTFSEAFYWAIARNMDASFSLDYFGSKGVGGGLESRYVFGDGTRGDAHLYYFVFTPVAGQTTSENSYIVRWEHSQVLPGGFNLAANVDYQNSFQFLKEFDNNFQSALVLNRSSQIYITKSWASYNFSLRAARFETSFPASSGSVITEYLPQISFDSFKIKLFSPLYFSFSSSFASWQYGWDYQYTANSQLSNTELAMSPVLSLPVNLLPWLTMNFSAEGNMKYYWKSVKPNVGFVDEPVLTYNYAVNAEFIGPVFYRIFNLGGGEGTGATRLKHIIEPSVSYRYESPIVNGSEAFNPYTLFRYHEVTYSLTNHLFLKKGTDAPREILTWAVGQTYYLAPEDSPMASYRWNGEIPRFSEIQSYLRLYPGGGLNFDGSASYNTYMKGFSSLRLGANLGSEADNVFLSLNWFKSSNPWYPNPWYDRSQVGANGGVRIPAWNLELKGQADFNLMEKKLMFAGVSAVYHYQCLDLKAEVLLYLYRATPDVQFKISFGLGNIGKTTDFLGGARFN